MSVPGEWFRRVRYLLTRTRVEAELRREMEAHRAMMAAPARFGNTLQLRERAHDVWGWRWLDDLVQDARYAVRTLAVSHRTFALTGVAMLAVGTGVTTAVFSVVSGMMLRPLPFAAADRLVQLHGTQPLTPDWQAVRNFDTYFRDSTSFEAMTGYEVGARYLREGGASERLMAVRTFGPFFGVLGVPALQGRTYEPADGAAVAVISEGFWRRRLGGAGDVVGRTLRLEGQSVTITGIMPDAFQFPYSAASLLPGVRAQSRTDLWLPFDRPLWPRGSMSSVTGRLKPGVSLAAAQAELTAIAVGLQAQYPDTNKDRGIAVVPLSQQVVPVAVRRLMFVLFGAVAIVLALACANVANLSLARMTFRQREVAVRAAIGASPSRLVRQFLAESLLLAATGGTAGLLIAWWLVKRLVASAAPYLPRVHEIGLDWRVFGFMLALCIVTGTLVGAAPAIVAARRDPRGTLQEAGTQGTMGPAQRRLRNGLVIAEVALAFVLGVGATVLLRELVRLRGTDAGLVAENVITVHVGHQRNAPEMAPRLYAIADRVAAIPGVQAAGFAQLLPLQSWGWTTNSTEFRVRGRPARREEFVIELRFVTPGYFDALGIPIRRGRGFTNADGPGSLPVIIVNETLARRAFPGEDPVGLLTTRGTIAGVIADVRQAHLDTPAAPEVYYPVAQNYSQVSELGMTLVVRARDRPEPLVDAIRSAIREVDPEQAVFGVKTMDGVVAESLSGFTLSLSILSAFALVAIVLALSGTYGVISYLASARAREYAIRVALGADRARVIRSVLGQGLTLTAAGLVLGVAGALAAAPLVALAPITVRRPDLFTLLPVALLIAAVAAAAALVPARRAAHVDTMTVLRAE
ncbi:MAG TPA: ABC transporter permease [Vicinamibacterales bacterium]|nr:ABC transporter permease [Vicinamibacterales bacterium]